MNRDALIGLGICVIGLCAIIAIGLGVYWVFLFISSFDTKHPCIKSHQESYTSSPIYVISGSAAIPIGGGTKVQHTICDERK